MTTRAKTSTSAKTPAAGKTKAAAPGKPLAKAVGAPAARPAVNKKTATAKTVKAAKPTVSDEQRRNYIEVAAYYIAERRGFFGASAMEDWAQAEAEVDRMLREGKLNQ